MSFCMRTHSLDVWYRGILPDKIFLLELPLKYNLPPTTGCKTELNASLPFEIKRSSFQPDVNDVKR